MRPVGDLRHCKCDERVVRDGGMELFCAGTHPFALWEDQRATCEYFLHGHGALQQTDRYSLALNSYITEVVEPSKRTGVFGRLQGCTMFGGAFGFLCK